MQKEIINVLFLCTHNSARSILAEGLLNHFGAPHFRAFSAGSQPRANQQPNPLALAVLEEIGIETDTLSSKSWDVFAQTNSPQMDIIITVCDNAAGEVCPIWPGRPASIHWGYPDPSLVDGTEAEKIAAFRAVRDQIQHRFSKWLALDPHLRMEPSVLQSL